MNIDAFIEKNDEIKKYDCRYYLHPNLWLKNVHITSNLHSQDDWSDYIKYLDDKNKVSAEIKNLPKDYGGIYVFLFKA